MAVTVGFEPTVGGYPTQLFESCTFGRSDTSPSASLRDAEPARQSHPNRGPRGRGALPDVGDGAYRVAMRGATP